MIHVDSVIPVIPLNMDGLMHVSTEGDCQSRLKTEICVVYKETKYKASRAESKGVGKSLGYY